MNTWGHDMNAFSKYKVGSFHLSWYNEESSFHNVGLWHALNLWSLRHKSRVLSNFLKFLLMIIFY